MLLKFKGVAEWEYGGQRSWFFFGVGDFFVLFLKILLTLQIVSLKQKIE